MTVEVQQKERLDPSEVAAVGALVDAVTDADGVRPLSEHILMHLRAGGDEGGLNLIVSDDGQLVGYGHLDLSDAVEGPSGELAVHPAARNRGIASALVDTMLEHSVDGRLRLWAHGQHPAATRLAAREGFRRQRVLWQMRRSLFAPLPDPAYPPGVTVRTFVPGEDEEAWTAVNNRAFASHPDQGGWSVDEVRLREKEPWFDPAGFFLAERDETLIGFHWTKVHGGIHGPEGEHQHAHEPIGEVYVVGVDPSAQGQGLGPALTLTGLRHLRSCGLAQAMLYVDESNTGAIKVYEQLGFARWDTDVCFSRT